MDGSGGGGILYAMQLRYSAAHGHKISYLIFYRIVNFHIYNSESRVESCALLPLGGSPISLDLVSELHFIVILSSGIANLKSRSLWIGVSGTVHGVHLED